MEEQKKNDNWIAKRLFKINMIEERAGFCNILQSNKLKRTEHSKREMVKKKQQRRRPQ